MAAVDRANTVQAMTPPRVAILAPNPALNVTVEAGGGAGEEIHFHPGGPGVWVAKVAGAIGARVEAVRDPCR